jgi:hypothetical protein
MCCSPNSGSANNALSWRNRIATMTPRRGESSGRGAQMIARALRDEIARFKDLDVVPMGVSCFHIPRRVA